MLTEDGNHLYVSYDEYHSLIENWRSECTSQVGNSTPYFVWHGWHASCDILSRIFNKPLAIMSTSSYRARLATVQGHLDIARFITTPKGEIAGRVLLVDDLADTGHTLHAVIDMLKTSYDPITELRSAVIWTKGVSTFTPDYSVGIPCLQIRGSTSLSRHMTALALRSCLKSGVFSKNFE